MRFRYYFAQRWRSLDGSWRFAITAFLLARLIYGLWSWLIFTIQPLAVQNIHWSGQPVLTVFSLKSSQAQTHLREIDGQILSFRAAGANTITDLQTGSTWDAFSGVALRGPYAGRNLSRAEVLPAEFFPYHEAHPYPVPWLALWQRFDANWYISIAENGYGGVEGDDHFPPLFVLLIRLLTPLFGSAFLGGLLIAHLATLYVLKLVYDLFLEWGEARLARRAVAFLLIYPASFFLFSLYSESLFLMTVLLSFRAMRTRSWIWSGFWAFCAILTRLPGAALVIPMLYLILSDPLPLRKPAHWMGLVLPAAGGLFYLHLRSQQVPAGTLPFVESEWHARLVPPWETYWYAIQTLLSDHSTFIDVLNWAVATLFIFLLLAGWRTIPLEYSLYTAFSLLIILIRIVETQPLISMSRYAMMLFPAFYALSRTGENPWTRRLILYSFIPLNLYLSAQFFSWGWVA